MSDPYAGMPLWFGAESWCPATDVGTRQETPVGRRCYHCDEPIDEGDCGYLRFGFGRQGSIPIHRECDFRMVMGGVECMRRQRAGTHIVGDHDPDPPDLSKRAAAQAAWAFWNEHHELIR